jgi:hypothetical protein
LQKTLVSNVPTTLTIYSLDHCPLDVPFPFHKFLLMSVCYHQKDTCFRLFSLAKSERTSPPTQLQFSHTGHTEFVICDYAIELIFRFLKRSLNGLHLLSHSPEGVTLHFYALLITALLELRLKQQCVDLCETSLSASTSPQTEADPPTIAGLMINPERLAGTRGNTFLATVGEKLHRYWKISKHWLVALRNYLAHPFDQQVVMALGQL